jgi:hypothetical protein
VLSIYLAGLAPICLPAVYTDTCEVTVKGSDAHRNASQVPEFARVSDGFLRNCFPLTASTCFCLLSLCSCNHKNETTDNRTQSVSVGNSQQSGA